MSKEPTCTEETLAQTSTNKERQLVLHKWTRHTPSASPGGNSTKESGYTVTIFDEDGNAVSTIARIECGTSIAAIFEHKAWDLYIELVGRLSTASVFDLGSGPDRQAA